MSYDDPQTKPIPETTMTGYSLRLNDTFSGKIIVALVLRDGEAIGSIRCQTMEEYEWLKEKLTGSKRSQGLERT